MTGYSNFTILFNQRVGSSAIVSMLSAQEGIHVPLFEGLDWRHFAANHRDTTLANVISDVFATGTYDKDSAHDFLFSAHSTQTKSIGFKIRIFGHIPDLVPVLLKHRVKVFVLSRRDFVEMVSSLYVSEMGQFDQDQVALTQHPQFEVVKMLAADKTRYLDDLDRLRIEVRHAEFARTAVRTVRDWKRLVRSAEVLHKSGIDIIPIYYEDFAADRVGFIRNFMVHLGFPPDRPVVDKSRFEKVMKSPARAKLLGLYRHPLWLRVLYLRFVYGRERKKLERLRGTGTV